MAGLRELIERIACGELTVDEGLRGMADRLRPEAPAAAAHPNPPESGPPTDTEA